MDLGQRVDKLEAFAEDAKLRLVRIEMRLDTIEALLATMAGTIANSMVTKAELKAEIAALETRMIKWFVGTAFTMCTIVASIAFAAGRFIH